jgi:hypothetical protein
MKYVELGGGVAGELRLGLNELRTGAGGGRA